MTFCRSSQPICAPNFPFAHSIDAHVSLEAYFSAPKTVERHIRAIRERHGFVYYADAPKLRMRLARWLYLECWMGNDRPGTLVLQAADWLVAHNVLLPGLSILERFVGRIRDRATTRLWARIVSGLSEAQRDQISSLLAQDASRLNSLGVLRATPLKRRQSDLWVHLDRLDVVRDLNMNLTPPNGVPVIQLERLARVARHSKPSAIAALKEPRRTATVAALLFTLEATAQDEATELGDALIIQQSGLKPPAFSRFASALNFKENLQEGIGKVNFPNPLLKIHRIVDARQHFSQMMVKCSPEGRAKDTDPSNASWKSIQC